MTPAHIVNNLLFVVPCILLLLLVFWDQLKTPTLLRIFIGGSIFLAGSFGGTYIYFTFESPMQHLVLSCIFLFSGVMIFESACKYNFWQCLFIISVIKSYSENVRFLSLDFYFLFTGELPGEAMLEISFITTVFTVLTFPAIWWFYSDFMRPALSCTVSLSVWKWIFIIPVSNGAVYMAVMAREAVYKGYPGGEFLMIPPLWVLLTFSTYGVLLKMMINVSKNAVLRENLHLSEIQITAQQKQMELLQKSIRKTSRFRHDLRHPFLAMEGFLKDEDVEGLKRYVRQSSTIFPTEPIRVYCESAAVNSLLSYYLELAEREYAVISCSVTLKARLPVPDAELCIIVGNLLENAVEAFRRMESKERFLDVKLSMPSDSILLIQICNNYEGTVRKAQDGTFLSSKEKGRKGIGISSVLSITEKYNGVVRLDCQEQIFKISVIISQYP